MTRRGSPVIRTCPLCGKSVCMTAGRPGVFPTFWAHGPKGKRCGASGRTFTEAKAKQEAFYDRFMGVK